MCRIAGRRGTRKVKRHKNSETLFSAYGQCFQHFDNADCTTNMKFWPAENRVPIISKRSLSQKVDGNTNV